MLALVLFAVLVWHTVVSPSYAPAPLRAVDGEPPDAEERESGAVAGRSPTALARPAALAADAFDVGCGPDEVDTLDLDWPEVIGGD